MENIKCSFSTTNKSSYSEVFSVELWGWDVELLEDGSDGVFFDFAMAGDAGDFAIGRV
jgi:hypothetical protein